MNSTQLRELQAPLKEQYRSDPESGRVTLTAEGSVDAPGIRCRVPQAGSDVDAGLHPASGGDGTLACSGDMLLEALVACAGVTLKAVATALDIPLKGGKITADGQLDFRGTLGVDKATPVGFERISLQFNLETDASEQQLETLLKLTERYCVVYQTLRGSAQVSAVLIDR